MVEICTTFNYTTFNCTTFKYFITGGKHRVTSAYHPQANGLVERTNASTTDMLRSCIEKQEDWLKLIPSLQNGHNTRTSQSTGFTPHEIIKGAPLRIFQEVTWQHDFDPDDQPGILPEEEDMIAAFESDEAVHAFVKDTEEKRAHILDRVKVIHPKQAAVYKKNFDKKHRGHMELEVGDLCFVDNRVHNHRMGGKLDAKWGGPYTVLEVFPDKNQYRLKNKHGQELVRKTPAARVKKCFTRESEGLPESQLQTEPPPRDGKSTAMDGEKKKPGRPRKNKLNCGK